MQLFRPRHRPRRIEKSRHREARKAEGTHRPAREDPRIGNRSAAGRCLQPPRESIRGCREGVEHAFDAPIFASDKKSLACLRGHLLLSAHENAGVAQLVEHLVANENVETRISSPALLSSLESSGRDAAGHRGWGNGILTGDLVCPNSPRRRTHRGRACRCDGKGQGRNSIHAPVLTKVASVPFMRRSFSRHSKNQHRKIT